MHTGGNFKEMVFFTKPTSVIFQLTFKNLQLTCFNLKPTKVKQQLTCVKLKHTIVTLDNIDVNLQCTTYICNLQVEI